LGPFSKVTDELLRLLRERYSAGTLRSSKGATTAQIPSVGSDVRVSYGLLNNPRDPMSGWRNLQISGQETPLSKNLKDNAVVAFAIQAGDADVDDTPVFDVEFPSLDDEADDAASES